MNQFVGGDMPTHTVNVELLQERLTMKRAHYPFLSPVQVCARALPSIAPSP
jgi:hypothetical protein